MVCVTLDKRSSSIVLVSFLNELRISFRDPTLGASSSSYMNLEVQGTSIENYVQREQWRDIDNVSIEERRLEHRVEAVSVTVLGSTLGGRDDSAS